MKIRTDSDEEFVRYILEARSEYLSLRLKQEPAIREIYVKAAANVADDIARLAPGTSDLTRNHLRALEKSLTREAENIRRALEGRLRSDLQQATGLGGRPLQAHMASCLQAAGVPLDMLRVQRGFGDVNTAAVEAIWARTRNGMKLSDRIWATSDNARDNMRSIILDGVARGRDSAKVARDLERYVKQGAATMAGDYPGMMARIGKRVSKDLCYEAFRLARSEMSMAFMEGTYASGRVNPAYKGVRWLLSSSHPLPDVCDDLASADLYGLGPGGYPAGDEPPYPHPNCVIAGTVVAGPRVLASTTRWYQGDVIEIKTASGNRLTVTPNHPILTPDGWVAAGLLKEGGYVVSGDGRDGNSLVAALSVVCPDDHQVPALIEDVAGAVGESSGVTPISVPVAAEDFHGDGEGSQICVIRANGFLANHADTLCRQKGLKSQFLRRRMELLSLSGASSHAEFFERPSAASYSGMGGLNVSAILFGGSLGVYQLLGLPERPAADTGCAQAGSDNVSRHSVPISKRLLGDSREVTGCDFIDGQGESGQESSRQLDGSQCLAFSFGTQEPAINDDVLQALIPDAICARDCVQAFAGAIRLDRIIDISRTSGFRGHVYNLQTALGWYVANNIVTHNCLCTVAPLAEDTKEFVERLKKWRDDPASQPELEKWYNEVYLGPSAQQPPPPQAGVAAPAPTQPAQPKAQARVAMTKAEWDRSLGKLAGKKDAELDAAVDELKQRFRSAFDADLEFNSGFVKNMSQRVKGSKTRKAVAELGVALNRMPIEATRDNPSFRALRLGDNLGGSYGDFSPSLGAVRIAASTFASTPEWAPDRLSHGYETLLHEVGHAAHHAHDVQFAPWVDEMWDLAPSRQGLGLWDLKQYTRATGTVKDPLGITNYGRTDPLEDFADTWRLLYVERKAPTRQTHAAGYENGRMVFGAPHRRFAFLRDLIKQLDWKVPGL